MCSGVRLLVELTADCLPHEHVAFSAQTHESPLPQQVAGFVTTIFSCLSVKIDEG